MTEGRDEVRLSEWRKGIFSLLDQAVVSFTSFVTMILVARYGNASQLALYALGWSIVGLAKTAQERTISAPYFVFSLRPDVDREKFLGSTLVHQAVQCGLFALVLLICGGLFYFWNIYAGMAGVFLSIAISVPMILMRDFVRTVSAAGFRNDISFVMSAVTCAIQLVGIVWIIRLSELTAWSVFAVMGIACLIPSAMWYAYHAGPHRFESSAVKSDWVRTWQYSRWLVAARSMGIATSFMLPWFTLFFAGEKGAGDFATCLSLVGLSSMFVVGSNNFFQPRAIHSFQTGGVRMLKGSLIQNLIAVTAMLGSLEVLYFVGASQLLDFIYGQGFGINHWVVVFLGVHALIVGWSFVVANGLAALEMPKGLFLAELSYFLVAIVSCLILLPIYGLIGAAMGLCFASVVGTSISFLTLVRVMRSLWVAST